MSKQNGGEIVFMVSSGWGYHTRQPYVQVAIEAADFMTQMPPETARELALNLLQAAEAAETDGHLIHFVSEKLFLDDMQDAAIILYEFRKARDKRRAASSQLQRFTIRE